MPAYTRTASTITAKTIGASTDSIMLLDAASAVPMAHDGKICNERPAAREG
jgi:hypothetical protein